ncbi:zinc-dependent peptidase [Winogradskyella sp. A3E31]|uniref:zinc-dependent peptidase n=1 Tax=Winogradskyella sp. A3E31 TaxID=3349637 RepID=UPI00398ADDE1
MSTPLTIAIEMHPTTRLVLIIIFFVGMAWIVLSRFYIYFEQLYAEKYNRPFFYSPIVFRKKLSKSQRHILRNHYSFYKKLNLKEKRIFRHRVATFIDSKDFVGREGLTVTDEMKVLIAATATTLTFGFKHYILDIIDAILIYPTKYINKSGVLHKGEFNPKMGAIVISWEDFKFGYEIGNDNLNLGIHEFGHAIHFNSFRNEDISAVIFSNGLKELKRYLRDNEPIRQKLIASHYFRTYAYTNEFEFTAVLLECFIETPRDFKAQFPKLYEYTKQMLNFNFAGY